MPEDGVIRWTSDKDENLSDLEYTSWAVSAAVSAAAAGRHPAVYERCCSWWRSGRPAETSLDICQSAEQAELSCPTKHIIGHIGDGFYGSKDPTNSIKALKEERSQELGFNPIRST